MRIGDRLSTGSPGFSFEFFPPRTERGVEKLFETVLDLRPLEPTYVSVTYPGSATSTPDEDTVRRRRLTLDLVRRIRAESGIEAMAHLTCSGHTRDELLRILDEMADSGMENVLALRGDPPGEGGGFVAVEGGFSHGLELVMLIREGGYPFCVGAACYPETHVEATTAEADLQHLKAKVDAGVDFLVTQLFFDNVAFHAFRDRALAAGVTVPIVPGLMPVTSAATVARMPAFGASIPDDLRSAFDASLGDDEAVLRVGVEHTTRQAADLLANGAPGIHFFTLNTSRATRAIVSSLREPA